MRGGSERGEVETPWPHLRKPVVGAINGAAITGGLELALLCDFLVASEQARFADTHARVGVMPGWGMTVLLPQAVGLRRAKQMSLTSRFVTAGEALRVGLVNQVVPHEELLPTALGLAEEIASADPLAVETLLASYDECASVTTGEALLIEQRVSHDWRQTQFDPAKVAERRDAVMARGRSQV
jgi:enoyl-CoA hydratase